MTLGLPPTRLRSTLPLPVAAGFVAAVLLSVMFVIVVYPTLATLSFDRDEGWFILGSRYISDGLRPFVDFPYPLPPLHLHLLALAAEVFGPTVLGYRMLSLLSLTGSGLLLFFLVRPVAGTLSALAAQAFFLFSAPQVHALGAVSEAPMLFFTLLATVFLFLGSGRASAYASGVAFVLALLIKPTCLVMILAAVLSLAVAGAWRRLADLALSGVVVAAASLAWILVASEGVFAEALRWQLLDRFSADIWSIPSGFSDMRAYLGIDTHWQLAVHVLKYFYNFPRLLLPIALLAVSLFGLPVWVVRCARQRPALAAFAVLWPASWFLLNFFAMDLVSAKYFVPFLAFSSFLLAGLVWLVQSFVPTLLTAALGTVALAGLVGYFSSALRAECDPWYFERAQALSRHKTSLVSFSPMLFAATGMPAGCDLWQPELTYGKFGETVFRTGERTRRFYFPPEKVIACLRAQPATSIVIDFWYYFFVRPGDPLDEYLKAEGRAQRLFFSPWAQRRWEDPKIASEGTQR